MKNLAISQGSAMLKALGNQKRLEIVYYLIEKEMNVGELEKKVNLSQSALSQHLAVLRSNKIVKTRRVAQTIFYSIQSEIALKLLQLLDKLYNKPYQNCEV